MKPDKTINKLISGNSVTIAAIGDSLTYGWLVSKGYIDYLAEMLGEKYPDSKINIINKGVPGDTAEGALKRLEEDVLKHNPDTVLIQFALNDALTGFSPSEFRKNIEEIINRIGKSTDADIVLITSIYLGYAMGGDLSNIFYGILEKIAERNKIVIVKVHQYWEKHIANSEAFKTLVQSDLLHPNESGYKLMAEAIMEIF